MAITTYGEVIRFVRSCKDPQELRDLNKEVVNALRNLQRELSSTYRPGDAVEFSIEGKRNWELNGLWVGTVQRSAGRTVRVLASRFDGRMKNMTWNVSPSSLREVSKERKEKK